jgi:hypothetical protein
VGEVAYAGGAPAQVRRQLSYGGTRTEAGRAPVQIHHRWPMVALGDAAGGEDRQVRCLSFRVVPLSSRPKSPSTPSSRTAMAVVAARRKAPPGDATQKQYQQRGAGERPYRRRRSPACTHGHQRPPVHRGCIRLLYHQLVCMRLPSRRAASTHPTAIDPRLHSANRVCSSALAHFPFIQSAARWPAAATT